MNRVEFEEYVLKTYSAQKDFPWVKYPSFSTIKHPKNKKCFAIIMDLPKSKLGMPGKEIISFVNLKCSPLMIGSLVFEKGIFPAYHMNKEHWISVALDGSVDDEKLKMLVDISFGLTIGRKK